MLTDPEQIEKICASVKFGADGLIPAIIQDASDGAVLMAAFMNRESLALSLQTGRTWFYSRSRQRLWQKGETSGHHQYIREVLADCDRDALLIKVDQVGAACHEGYRSCFFRKLGPEGGRQAAPAPVEPAPAGDILDALSAVIRERRLTLPENSYTTKLFRKGIDRIAQKVGEEAVEVVIAGKNRSRDDIINETADLVYHLLVLLTECDVSLDDIRTKLAERRSSGSGARG